jgi:hypothetical protein
VAKAALKYYGLADIAEELGQQRKTVTMWRVRGHLPRPDFFIGRGRIPVWRARTIRPWIEERRGG